MSLQPFKVLCGETPTEKQFSSQLKIITCVIVNYGVFLHSLIVPADLSTKEWDEYKNI